jgi:hypothetical protein
MPQFVGTDAIGYLAKAGPTRGLVYVGGRAVVAGDMRSPAWSPDGASVVFERVGFTPRPQNLKLYSWDPDYEYRYTDVFPSFAKDGTLVVTRKDGTRRSTSWRRTDRTGARCSRRTAARRSRPTGRRTARRSCSPMAASCSRATGSSRS